MKLHKVLEELKDSGLCVFRTADMARLLRLSSNAASVYIHRMKRMGMVHSVEKGKFSISLDPFTVSTQIVFPSYISFSTALYLHGRLDQVIDNIYVVSSRKKKHMNYMDTGIRFVRFPPSRIFGYRKQRKGDSFVMLADPEKTAVDCLYLPRYTTVSQVFEALSPGLDKMLIEEYAVMMKSEAVIRRGGYILEALGEDTGLKPSTGTVYKLNPSIRRRGEYDSRWKMYINEVLER